MSKCVSMKVFFLISILIFDIPSKDSVYQYGGANNLSLGLSHRCFERSEQESCFVGQKLTIEHSFLSKGKSHAPEYRPLDIKDVGSLNRGYYHYGSGDVLLAMILVYFFILVFFVYIVPGVAWIFGSIFANYLESGIYASHLMLSEGQGSGVNSLGVKISSYPFQNIDFNFYLGAAYSFTSLTSDKAEGGSMQFGIGLVPKRSGFIAALEFEKLFLNEKIKNIHAQEILEDSKNLGQSSLVLGWRF
ncbi:MAG: hypothetical protein AB8G05_13885 [Oligoflexales bacterium]